MIEAISLALKGSVDDSNVDFAHQSVTEALALFNQTDFNDLDAPYLVVDDEVKLNGRAWREASVDSVVSILAGASLRR